MSTRTTIVFVLATCAGAALLLTSGLPVMNVLSLLIAAFTLLWMVSVVIDNASIVDVFWGPGFVLVGVAPLPQSPGRSHRPRPPRRRAGNHLGRAAGPAHRHSQRPRRWGLPISADDRGLSDPDLKRPTRSSGNELRREAR
jgi:hypothetical protein